MSCVHEHEDAAYVLGALSANDRADFEAHLPDCAACLRAVGELAGLPGLLARTPVDRVEPADPPPAVPDTLLPTLVGRVRTRRRRRALVTGALAAAAAAVVVALGVTLAHPGGSPGGSVAPAVAMRSVGDDPVSATVSLTAQGWGTRLELTCDERDDPASAEAAPTTPLPAAWASYAMFVHTKTGGVEQVATWKAVPGGVVHVSGATATERSDIVGVDVRNAAGATVLDLGR